MEKKDRSKLKKNNPSSGFLAYYKKELVFVLFCLLIFFASLAWVYFSRHGLIPPINSEDNKDIVIEKDEGLLDKYKNLNKYREMLAAGLNQNEYKITYRVLGMPDYMMDKADELYVTINKLGAVEKNSYSYSAEQEITYVELFKMNDKNFICSKPGKEAFIMGMGFSSGCKELMPEIDRHMTILNMAETVNDEVELEYEGEKERAGRKCEFFRIKNEGQNFKRYFSFGSEYDYELLTVNKEVCLDKETSLPIFIRLSHVPGDKDILTFVFNEVETSVNRADTVSATPFVIEKAGKSRNKIIFFLKPFGSLDNDFIAKTKKIELEKGKVIEALSESSATSSPGEIFRLDFEVDTEADLYDLCYLDYCFEVNHLEIISSECLEHSLDNEKCESEEICIWEEPYCLRMYCENAPDMEKCNKYYHCEWVTNEEGEYCSEMKNL